MKTPRSEALRKKNYEEMKTVRKIPKTAQMKSERRHIMNDMRKKY
jgi:hypothetical protein